MTTILLRALSGDRESGWVGQCGFTRDSGGGLGGDGNNTMDGGADRETIVGGSRDNTLKGGGGLDRLLGGPDNDQFEASNLRNTLGTGTYTIVGKKNRIDDAFDINDLLT